MDGIRRLGGYLMKLAICFDECGSEISIECSSNETAEQLRARYPEYRFRYWEEYDPDKYYRGSSNFLHYDPESDSYV